MGYTSAFLCVLAVTLIIYMVTWAVLKLWGETNAKWLPDDDEELK